MVLPLPVMNTAEKRLSQSFCSLPFSSCSSGSLHVSQAAQYHITTTIMMIVITTSYNNNNSHNNGNNNDNTKDNNNDDDNNNSKQHDIKTQHYTIQ